MGLRIEKILPQIVYFYLSTKLIRSKSTRLYRLNFSKLNTRDPMDVNYYVAILTNSSERGQALSIV